MLQSSRDGSALWPTHSPASPLARYHTSGIEGRRIGDTSCEFDDDPNYLVAGPSAYFTDCVIIGRELRSLRIRGLALRVRRAEPGPMGAQCSSVNCPPPQSPRG